MTDEEKEAIEQLRSWREYIIKHKEDVNKANDIEFYLRTVINLIEKQQKEIEELKEDECVYKETSSCTKALSFKTYKKLNNIDKKWEAKIKAKLEEVKEIKNEHSKSFNWADWEDEDVYTEIELWLQSLLEKE